MPSELEVDFVELIEAVWEGRWLVLTSTIIFALGGIGLGQFQPAPNYTAVTFIHPISSSEAEKYRSSNAFNFFKVKSFRQNSQIAISDFKDSDGRQKTLKIEKDTVIPLVPEVGLIELFLEMLTEPDMLKPIFEKVSKAILEYTNSSLSDLLNPTRWSWGLISSVSLLKLTL